MFEIFVVDNFWLGKYFFLTQYAVCSTRRTPRTTCIQPPDLGISLEAKSELDDAGCQIKAPPFLASRQLEFQQETNIQSRTNPAALKQETWLDKANYSQLWPNRTTFSGTDMRVLCFRLKHSSFQ